MKDTVRFTDTIFNYKNVDYFVNTNAQDIILISIKYKKQTIGSVVNIISLSKDSKGIAGEANKLSLI